MKMTRYSQESDVELIDIIGFSNELKNVNINGINFFDVEVTFSFDLTLLRVYVDGMGVANIPVSAIKTIEFTMCEEIFIFTL